jgi:hypothetical protein
VSRGRKSQQIAAEYLQDIFPEAVGIAASLQGRDILNTEDWAFEMKATKDFKPTEFLRQAEKNGDGDWSVALYRPRGYGPEKAGLWVGMMSFDTLKALISHVRQLEARVAELSNRTNS